ncbi:dihydrodipicolinate synthase family protein [Phytoactinopolyspora alkaliphila]|uniref:Dihydrodipicolinate synthase family protein n=1 Tax=Phytoactinopolyspora alkaliphila TaxID=1783498 RepID=A0A6N9YSF4_9ACTN|nr:dihydrodipicolinate synthase family protein [Phytoactinopolyspora alkaliphila]NED97867.1 dihydrodipicolinate synthase family protein [Phytoactinopolyspora alkaliphila]
MSAPLAGVWPAPLTMFDADGGLDEDAMAAHLDWLITAGVHGLVINGTSGEFIALTDAERRRVLEIAVRTSGGRVPVLAGTGSYTTADSIRLTRHAAQAGAEAALVVLPYFQRPSRAEVLDHYRAIAAAVEIPLFVYNIPANAATAAVTVPDLATLYAEGVVCGVKNTGPAVHVVNQLRTRLDDGFRIFYGGTTAPVEAMAGGAHGWVSGLLNVIPAAAVSLWTAMVDGDLEGARRDWGRLWIYRELLAEPLFPDASDLAIYRGLLRVWGRPAGYCRPPLRDLDSHQLTELEKKLATA